MHIYSLRLWMVMIVLFAGVSVARAESMPEPGKCWVLHEWTVAKGQPAGRPRAMSECIEGTIVKESAEVTTCRISSRKTGARNELAYYTDAACKNSHLATNSGTAKIPEEKKSGVVVKPEKRQMQIESKTPGSAKRKPGTKVVGGRSDPNSAGTPPAGGSSAEQVEVRANPSD